MIPVQKQIMPAIVIRNTEKLEVNYPVKPIISVEQFPEDQNYLSFIEKISNYYQVPHLALIKRFRKFIEQAGEAQEQHIAQIHTTPNNNHLSPDQTAAYQKIVPAVLNQEHQVTILHGVTGSGKTEVYKYLIETALAQQKTVLLLLPEVSLAMRFEAIMRSAFNSVPIFGFHSASSAQQKKKLWQKLLMAEPTLIIGVHLPTLLPIANLGLIIVDEEHDVGYQEKKHPQLNSKEMAIMRAHQYGIPVVLGSATPSISSLYNLKRPNWQLISMPKRFSGAFPTIKVARLGVDKKQAHFLITKELHHSIQTRLNQKEQIIIFLNRRGYSFFVQCLGCQFVFHCPNCSVSLTLHQDESLRCHYCDFEKITPKNCPECKSAKLLKKGVGTQQIVAILEKLFPLARIERADLDTTLKKKNWQKILQDFTDQKIDILVGTQTITKGYHFPNVTLVGILWADINLHMPIFNAAETTLQQILQVAGRAGRQKLSSEVIVQTMTDHSIFNFLSEIDYLKFYANEIENRKIVEYPPIIRLAEIELKHYNEMIVDKEINQFFELVKNIAPEISNKIKVLGPVKPTISKLKKWHIRKIYLKSERIDFLIAIFKQVDQRAYQSQVCFTPNPLS